MKQIFVYGGIMAFAFLMLWFAYQADGECEKSGGVLVRGAVKYICVHLGVTKP